jgi:hypothetical protein
MCVYIKDPENLHALIKPNLTDRCMDYTTVDFWSARVATFRKTLVIA